MKGQSMRLRALVAMSTILLMGVPVMRQGVPHAGAATQTIDYFTFKSLGQLDTRVPGAIYGSVNAQDFAGVFTAPDTTQHTFVYDLLSSTFSDLGRTSTYDQTAVSVNGTYSAGSHYAADGTEDAFRVNNASGISEDIGHLQCYVTRAVAVNDSGHAVGEGSVPGPFAGGVCDAYAVTHAFIDYGSSPQDLGYLGIDKNQFNGWSDALAISNNDVVTGDSSFGGGNGTEHAFRWVDGSMVDLGALDNGSGPNSNSTGMKISPDGTYIVGQSTVNGPGTASSFLWHQGDGMSDVGQDGLYALNVNDSGHILSSNNTLYDGTRWLPVEISQPQYASVFALYGVDDSDQIAAMARDSSGNLYAGLLVPHYTPLTTASAYDAYNNPYTFGQSSRVPVTVNLQALPSKATTYYALNNSACSPSNTAACQTYSSPFTVSQGGATTITYFSVDSYGTAESVNTATVNIATVDPPQNLRAVPGNGGTATVSWTPPDNTNTYPVSSYSVTVKNGDGSTNSTATVGSISNSPGCAPSCSTAISGLDNATDYEIDVTASGSQGSSSPATAQLETLPGTVSGVTASTGDKTLTVTWNPPSDTEPALTGYQVQAFPCTSTSVSSCSSTAAASQLFSTTCGNANTPLCAETLSSLTDGTRYRVAVTAQDNAGSGSRVYGTTLVAPDGPPSFSPSGPINATTIYADPRSAINLKVTATDPEKKVSAAAPTSASAAGSCFVGAKGAMSCLPASGTTPLPSGITVTMGKPAAQSGAVGVTLKGTDALPQGTYTLVLTATDAANQTATSTITFTVSPETAALTPDKNNTLFWPAASKTPAVIKVTARGDKAHTPYISVRYAPVTNLSNVTTCNQASGSASCSLTGLPVGVYSIQYDVNDGYFYGQRHAVLTVSDGLDSDGSSQAGGGIVMNGKSRAEFGFLSNTAGTAVQFLYVEHRTTGEVVEGSVTPPATPGTPTLTPAGSKPASFMLATSLWTVTLTNPAKHPGGTFQMTVPSHPDLTFAKPVPVQSGDVTVG